MQSPFPADGRLPNAVHPRMVWAPWLTVVTRNDSSNTTPEEGSTARFPDRRWTAPTAGVLDHAARFIKLARHEQTRQHSPLRPRSGSRAVAVIATPTAVPPARTGLWAADGDSATAAPNAARAGPRSGDAVKLAQAQPRQRQLLIIKKPLLHQIGVVRSAPAPAAAIAASAARTGKQVVITLGQSQRNHHTQVQPAFGARRDRVSASAAE